MPPVIDPPALYRDEEFFPDLSREVLVWGNESASEPVSVQRTMHPKASGM
jgi:hypothetical protein